MPTSSASFVTASLHSYGHRCIETDFASICLSAMHACTCAPLCGPWLGSGSGCGRLLVLGGFVLVLGRCDAARSRARPASSQVVQSRALTHMRECLFILFDGMHNRTHADMSTHKAGMESIRVQPNLIACKGGRIRDMSMSCDTPSSQLHVHVRVDTTVMPRQRTDPEAQATRESHGKNTRGKHSTWHDGGAGYRQCVWRLRRRPLFQHHVSDTCSPTPQ